MKNLLIILLGVLVACTENVIEPDQTPEALKEPLNSVSVEFELRGVELPRFSVRYGDTPGECVYIGNHQSIIWINESWSGLNAEFFIFHGVGHILGLNHGPEIMSSNAYDVLIEWSSNREEWIENYFNQLQ